MLDDTVPRLHHALGLAAGAALREALHAVAEVAESAIFLPTVTQKGQI